MLLTNSHKQATISVVLHDCAMMTISPVSLLPELLLALPRPLLLLLAVPMLLSLVGLLEVSLHTGNGRYGNGRNQ